MAYMGYFNLLNFPAGVVPITKCQSEDTAEDLKTFPPKDMFHKAMKSVIQFTHTRHIHSTFFVWHVVWLRAYSWRKLMKPQYYWKWVLKGGKSSASVYKLIIKEFLIYDRNDFSHIRFLPPEYFVSVIILVIVTSTGSSSHRDNTFISMISMLNPYMNCESFRRILSDRKVYQWLFK